MALSVSNNGSDHLVFTSTSKGSEVSFTVVSDQTGGGTGIGTSGMSDAGLDIEGTYTDTTSSTVYSASGSGEVLTGAEGPVEGLRTQYFGTTTGTFGTISVTFGYAERLERALESYVDSLEGPISGAVEYLEANIRRIDDDILRIEDRLVNRERYLTIEFSKINQALQELSYLQTTLSAQLGQLDALIS
jgi:flagellar capping protein FliD